MSDPLQATRVLSGAQLRPVAGGFAAIITNPLDIDYLGLPPKGTRLPDGSGLPGPDGPCVLSVGEDNRFSMRKLDQIGNFETAVKQGMFLVYRCWGANDIHRYPIPFAE